MSMKIHGRQPSLFFDIGFITFNNTNNPPKCNTKLPRCARGKIIFFMCAVIYMEQMKIKYYNSLHFDNVTRHSCRHKIKMQEYTLQVLRDYLQKGHMKEKHIDFPNEWKLYTMRNVPQQDTTNTTNCGVFVCMYCNSILNDCKLDFKQNNITYSDLWRYSYTKSLCCDSAFAHKKEFSIFKIPWKVFGDLLCRDLTLYSLSLLC